MKKRRITFGDGALLTGAAVLVGAMIIAALSPEPTLSKEERARQRRQQEKENEKKMRRAQLRAKVFKRARGRCENCDEKRTLKVYYIVGPYQSGRCTYNNLQALCSWCGRAKSVL